MNARGFLEITRLGESQEDWLNSLAAGWKEQVLNSALKFVAVKPGNSSAIRVADVIITQATISGRNLSNAG